MIVDRRDFIRLTVVGAGMLAGVPIEITKRSPPPEKVFGVARMLKRVGLGRVEISESWLYHLGWVLKKGPFKAKEYVGFPNAESLDYYMGVLTGISEGIETEGDLLRLDMIFAPAGRPEKGLTTAVFHNPVFVEKCPMTVVYPDFPGITWHYWQYEFEFDNFVYHGAKET